MSSSSYVIPESESTVTYPSGRKKKLNSRGEVIYDSAKDKDKK